MMYDVFGRIGKEGKWSLYRKRAASHSSETARLNVLLGGLLRL